MVARLAGHAGAATGCGGEPRGDASVEPAVSAAALLAWDTALEYRYELALSSEVEYGPETKLSLTLASALRVRVLLADASRQTLALTLIAPRFGDTASAQVEFAALAAELERGFSAEYVDGQLTQVTAGAETTPFAANIMRSVAAAFELPNETPGKPWLIEGEDAAGAYTAELVQLDEPGSLRKQKLRYAQTRLDSPGGSAVSLTLAPRVVASKGELRLRDGALATYVYHEQLETELGRDAVARADTNLSLRLSRVQPATADDRAQVSATHVLAKAAPHLTRTDRAALDSSKIANFTFESALSELAAHVAQEARPDEQPSDESNAQLERHHRAFSALSTMLATRPETVRRALAHVRAGRATAPLVIDALGAADTEAASAGLIALADDVSLRLALRERAAHVLTRIESPHRASVLALIRMMDDRALGLYAVYGLGTQARRLRERGDTELASQAGRALVERLAQETRAEARVHVLRGLANSGFVDALSVVRPLLHDADKTVRSAAVEALRLMDAPEVDALIAARLADEESPFVRRAALSAAKLRRPSDTLRAAVLAVAVGPFDNHSRHAAITLLGRWLPGKPDLGAALREIAETDPMAAMRSAAKAAL